MNISILTSGTRGDVQPYVALGKELQDRGHHILLACPDNFASWVEEHGLKFHPMGIDMQTFVQSPSGRKLLQGNPFAFIKVWKGTIIPSIRQGLLATWEAARDADVIVYHPKTSGAVDVAEATGAKLVFTAPFPIFPTKAFPFLFFNGDFGPRLNKLSYILLRMNQEFFRSIVNRWRKEMLGLGLKPPFKPDDGQVIQLCAASPSVVPYPQDEDEGIHTTGYWFLNEAQDWQPDAQLASFLKVEPAPVYIGFGSMPVGNPKKLTREVIEGVKRSRVRAILATGWGGLQDIDVPDTIHVIESAPHEKLFKHVCAVVHHGGAGTTAAGLRAGLPTLICHTAFDQPYWGRRVYSLECGPRPLSLKRLRADQFAQRLKELTRSKSFQIHARKIARAIAKEDGIAAAIQLIEATRSF